MAIFSTVHGASAQAAAALCDGSIRTLDISYQFTAKTGDLYTNVQDDSMLQLDVRDTLNNNVHTQT